MVELETAQCLACGRPLTQLGGGHRKRRYCDEACRQRAHRARQAQEKREQRETSDQEQSARLKKLEEEKQALLKESSRQAGEALQQKLQIEKLMAENAGLRRRLDVEANYRMDTRQHNFKPWLKKRPFSPGSFVQRFVDDKALPPQASRAHYEAFLRSEHYSEEDIETFRDLWKAMLLS
jgi:hypothetical protein